MEAGGPDRLQIGEGDEAVEAIISTSGGQFRIDPQEIKENLPGRKIPIRLGIDFAEPVQEGDITVTITPKYMKRCHIPVLGYMTASSGAASSLSNNGREYFVRILLILDNDKLFGERISIPMGRPLSARSTNKP